MGFGGEKGEIKLRTKFCPRQMPELTEPGRGSMYMASEVQLEPIPQWLCDPEKEFVALRPSRWIFALKRPKMKKGEAKERDCVF